jgi:hypothetical protein
MLYYLLSMASLLVWFRILLCFLAVARQSAPLPVALCLLCLPVPSPHAPTHLPSSTRSSLSCACDERRLHGCCCGCGGCSSVADRASGRGATAGNKPQGGSGTTTHYIIGGIVQPVSMMHMRIASDTPVRRLLHVLPSWLTDCCLWLRWSGGRHVT